MKITFDQQQMHNTDKVAPTSYRMPESSGKKIQSGYAIDISGTVMDNNAYKGHGKTAEEVMQDAGQIDIAVQRDYMTVMSNSMSTEDFNRMIKDGYDPMDMEIEESVTIVDQIKAAMIKGGANVVGYTDSIDKDTLVAITGSEVLADEMQEEFYEQDVPLTLDNAKEAKEAYDEYRSVGELSENTVKYLVENQIPLTIDGVYRADFSSVGGANVQGRGYFAENVLGYYGKKAEEYNWNQLMPQIDKIIAEAGLDATDDTRQEAKWLIEKGIPLTDSSLRSLHSINELSMPLEDREVIASIVSSIADAKAAAYADLSDGRSSLRKAVDIYKDVMNLSPAAADGVASSGVVLNIENLRKEQQNYADNNNHSEAYENPRARRLLEETRLVMTIEANKALIKSGYQIETAELEELVGKLREAEDHFNKVLFGTDDTVLAADKKQLLTESSEKIAEMPFLPVSVIGRYRVENGNFSLNSVYDEGKALQAKYEAAGEKYETLMTAPRADLGDSISKAFRNVDDILLDHEMELSEENRRSVRILGYNNSEITKETIEAVSEADSLFRSVIGKLTPAALLEAIRDNVNPLVMSVAELGKYLDRKDRGENPEDRYGAFIYKLEKSKKITSDEKDAFIGIMRMVKTIEKSDDAAIGTVLGSGAELTFSNLLAAARSRRHGAMDYMISDEFGGISGETSKGSITDQILNAFAGLSIDGLSKAAEVLDGDKELNQAYLNEEIKDYRNLSLVDDSITAELLSYDQKITAGSILAEDMLLNARGFMFAKTMSFASEGNKDKLTRAIEKMSESLSDKEEALSAASEYLELAGQVLNEKAEETISYIDLKAMKSIRKQMSLTRQLASEENYQVPAWIDGELTSINLKFVHDKDNAGRVTITLETAGLGKVGASFREESGKVQGYILCSNSYGFEELEGGREELSERIKESLADSVLSVGDISFVKSDNLSLNSFAYTDDAKGLAENTDLYKIAKAFISFIRR